MSIRLIIYCLIVAATVFSQAFASNSYCSNLFISIGPLGEIDAEKYPGVGLLSANIPRLYPAHETSNHKLIYTPNDNWAPLVSDVPFGWQKV